MRIDRLIPIRFGKLCDGELSLRPGLNVVYGANESGKSTYAALIRFLLYGFSSQSKSRQNPLPERVKYVPWSEAGASGSMVYEQDGRLYRLQRQTKGTRQAFAVFDEATGAPVQFLREPGEEMFGLSRATFESTAFFGQSLLSALSMEEIESKLRNIATGADENVSAQKALDKLKNARNAIDNGRGHGALVSLMAQRERLRAELAGIEDQMRRHEQLQLDLFSLMRTREELERRMGEFREKAANMERSRAEATQQRRAQLAAEQSELRAVSEQLSRGLKCANRDELDRIKERLYRYEAMAEGGFRQRDAAPAPKGAPVWPWIAAALAAGLGAALLFLRRYILGACLIAAGVGAAAAGCVLWSTRRRGKKEWDAQRARAQADAESHRAARAWLRGELSEFFARCGVPEESEWKEQLRRQERDLARYEEIRTRLNELALRLNALGTDAPAKDETQARQELTRLREQAAQLDTRIAALQGELQARQEHRQAADSIQSSLNELDEREPELRRQLDIYNLAMNALETARGEMTRLFSPALNKRAAELFSLLTGSSRTAKIDSEGVVRVEQGGEVHDIGYFSSGTADAAYIAMRLACVDLLYTQSLPPLLFDDSFCNLDEGRRRTAFSLLAELAQRYQILYFTCRDESQSFGGAPCNFISLS